MPDDNQLDLEHLRPKLREGGLPKGEAPPIQREFRVVTHAPATVEPLAPSTYELDGQVLWELVDMKHELMNRPGISEGLRHSLARSADLDQARAEARCPRPCRPLRLERRQAG